jgi:hypothetical protein
MMIHQIGEDAGRVWKCLSQNPSVTLEQIPKELKLKESLAFMAIGWLAREDKLAFEHHGKTTKVSLVAK